VVARLFFTSTVGLIVIDGLFSAAATGSHSVVHEQIPKIIEEHSEFAMLINLILQHRKSDQRRNMQEVGLQGARIGDMGKGNAANKRRQRGLGLRRIGEKGIPNAGSKGMRASKHGGYRHEAIAQSANVPFDS
jgi:hypothetical protein